MLFMNEDEIDEAVMRHAGHPVLSKATKCLADLRDVVNQNSDGWHVWPKPCRAAKNLQSLIQSCRLDQSAATEAALKQALKPIKSFYTRYRDKMTRGEPLVFPC